MKDRESGVPESAREWQAPKEKREGKAWTKTELITAVDAAMQKALDKRGDPARHRLTVEAVAQVIRAGAHGAHTRLNGEYTDEDEAGDPRASEIDGDNIFTAQELLKENAKPGKAVVNEEELQYFDGIIPNSFRVEDLVQQLRREVGNRPAEPTFLLPRVIAQDKYIDLDKIKRAAGADRPVYGEFTDEDWQNIWNKSQRVKKLTKHSRWHK